MTHNASNNDLPIGQRLPLNRFRQIISYLNSSGVSDDSNQGDQQLDLFSIQEAMRLASTELEPGEVARRGLGITSNRPNRASDQPTVGLAEAILDQCPDAMIVLSNFFGVSCNANACELFGLPKNEILEKNFLQLISQTFKVGQEWLKGFEEGLKQDALIECEIQRHQQGGWFELSFRKVEFGGQQQILAIFRDISRRKHFELRLEHKRDLLKNTITAVPETIGVEPSDSVQASDFDTVVDNDPPIDIALSHAVPLEKKRENRLRLLASVFENAQEGVAILNPAGEICEANPEFIATIGKSHAKVLGASLSNVINCGPHHFTEIIELVRAGRPWFGNIKLVNKRQEEIACWLSLSPAKNSKHEITNLIAMFLDITQIEETKRELRRQALHDHLTQLPNRRYFRKQISDLIESDTDRSVRFSVCFLDLDDFKIVNDTLGHDAGDHLLIEVSKRVKKLLGPDCFIARFGGDEFALLIPEQHNVSVRSHDKSLEVVNVLSHPFELTGHQVHIGVSIGTTVYPDHAKDVETLMRHADVAMYKAKEEGKNKVTFFSSELAEAVEKRQEMLAELRHALENDALTVVYQPKLCLKDNCINSCEALVRWTREDGSVVPTKEFIPLAEDFGLISKLGDQVLRTVCQQARLWHESGQLTGPIAVNLSPKQMKEQCFFDRLLKIIEEYQICPTWIEFEITENAVIADKERALKLMQKIRQLGVSIAMDDFGTGYSSLSAIKDFPIQTLKIDNTFVKDLPHCSRAVAVAKTVLSLGHGLDLKVVAEGVENIEQLEFLRESGCDVVQGYLVSRPLTGEDYGQFSLLPTV